MIIGLAVLVVSGVLGAQEKNAEEASQDLSTWNSAKSSPFAEWFQPGSHVRLPYYCRWDVQLRDGRAFAKLKRHKMLNGAPRPVFSVSGLPFELKENFTMKGMTGDIVYAEVDDGWIVAFNGGEWGAGLWWFSPDGIEKKKISEEWIDGFFRTGVGLVAVASKLLVPTTGYLVRIFKNGSKKWVAEKWVDFGHLSSAAFKETADTLLLLTSTRLLRVDLQKRVVAEIAHDEFWGPMQPRSLVVEKNGTVVIGMIGCVVKVHKTPKGPSVEWLTPKVGLKGCGDEEP